MGRRGRTRADRYLHRGLIFTALEPFGIARP
jgi:hypothetical protein